ncbi:DDE superfamily endonuclease [Phytophthora infestans]|uniref:DDE superfamily endonuclease n=1 Tax=Phytophthora infestans TaxID=4787 RepID=A0A8S9VG45_PHYIN|nr:DDE superfamily endonuclease [Phytophthora infestans]
MVTKVLSKRKKLLYLVLLQNGEIERPRIPDIVFSLAALTVANCELEFGFDIVGLQRLCILLRVPDVIITAHRDRAGAIEALFIMRRIHYVYTSTFYALDDPVQLFRVYFFTWLNMFTTSLPRRFILLTIIWRNEWGFIALLSKIKEHRSTLFLAFPMELSYVSAARLLVQELLAVTAPDGMCIHFWGPMEWRRHDSAMLRESKLMSYFEEHEELFGGRFLYGDPAYGMQKFILSEYKGNVSNHFERAFNKQMSSVKESVE